MNKKKYYNWQQIDKEKFYDFTIGEHLKGRKYEMSHHTQKVRLNRPKGNYESEKQAGIL